MFDISGDLEPLQKFYDLVKCVFFALHILGFFGLLRLFEEVEHLHLVFLEVILQLLLHIVQELLYACILLFLIVLEINSLGGQGVHPTTMNCLLLVRILLVDLL